jgi:hypothetical protein
MINSLSSLCALSRPVRQALGKGFEKCSCKCLTKKLAPPMAKSKSHHWHKISVGTNTPQITYQQPPLVMMLDQARQRLTLRHHQQASQSAS